LARREIKTSAAFDKLFKRLPARVRQQALEKLNLYLNDPQHPSLRAKRVRGTDAIWEMSVTMNYRMTFELPDDSTILLRRIGTHDTLRNP
jgi:mRNA-degrading endonuclease YafQ of YafQ-DinJ toxin-antitoxin module